MNQELTNKIYSRFPEIYCQHTLPKEETSMYWGIQCGDGWFDLIWKMSEEIETLARAQNIPIPEMSEIKQKMGGLRVRLFSNNPTIVAAVKDVEEMALYTCEKCGRSGKLRRMKGLISVRCEEHANGAAPVEMHEFEIRHALNEAANSFQAYLNES